MFQIGGMIFVFVTVFGGYALAGGGFEVILHALPYEGTQILGAAIGALLIASSGTTLKATITDKVSPGVVYTTFHFPGTQANVITTDFSDWATNCPEYKVTAVQVSPSNGPSEWQKEYEAQAAQSRRILAAE